MIEVLVGGTSLAPSSAVGGCAASDRLSCAENRVIRRDFRIRRSVESPQMAPIAGYQCFGVRGGILGRTARGKSVVFLGQGSWSEQTDLQETTLGRRPGPGAVLLWGAGWSAELGRRRVMPGAMGADGRRALRARDVGKFRDSDVVAEHV